MVTYIGWTEVGQTSVASHILSCSPSTYPPERANQAYFSHYWPHRVQSSFCDTRGWSLILKAPQRLDTREIFFS